MSATEKKIIALSKIKIALLTFVSFIFVVLGFILAELPLSDFQEFYTKFEPSKKFFVGCVSILFFGFCGLMGIRKYFDDTPGLILDQDGIFDNSGGVSLGFIPWSDVSSIQESQVSGQKFVSLMLHDSEKYMVKGNTFQQMSNRANMKISGTPISISANSLQISHEKLLEVIHQYFDTN